MNAYQPTEADFRAVMGRSPDSTPADARSPQRPIFIDEAAALAVRTDRGKRAAEFDAQ